MSIRLSNALYAQLSQHAIGRDMEPTVAARDLIRRGLGIDEHLSMTEEVRIAARRELHGHLSALNTEE